MIEKNVCSTDCNEKKNSYKNFSAHFARLLVYTKFCLEL